MDRRHSSDINDATSSQSLLNRRHGQEQPGRVIGKRNKAVFCTKPERE
jgi:hypothetical protein